MHAQIVRSVKMRHDASQKETYSVRRILEISIKFVFKREQTGPNISLCIELTILYINLHEVILKINFRTCPPSVSFLSEKPTKCTFKRLKSIILWPYFMNIYVSLMS